MKNILFYSPFNQRSRDTESLMIAFSRMGHRVFSLSQQEGLIINDFLNERGIEATSYVVPGKRSGWRYYLKHLRYFIAFCRRKKIDIVYSHLEPANFVASVGQYFVRATTYLCRHHIDEGSLYNFDRDLYYKVTYKLARRVIVVSEHSKRYMIEKEGIPAQKIQHINLAYDFSLYPMPDDRVVADIRARQSSRVLLLGACRLTRYKRPDEIIYTLKRLVDKHIDASLILLGKGEMEEDLRRLIADAKLEDRVAMPGYVSNVMDYMAAADFFLHPSLLDSSCVAVKEAGLVHLPAIVCKGVGDFDEYLRHGVNGFLVDRDHYAEATAAIVSELADDGARRSKIGTSLREAVINNFAIENVITQYQPHLT